MWNLALLVFGAKLDKVVGEFGGEVVGFLNQLIGHDIHGCRTW